MGGFHVLAKLVVFLAFFHLEVAFVEASEESLLHATLPEGCVSSKAFPCAVASGEKPFYFFWDENRWELARQTVISGVVGSRWRVASGQLVVQSHNTQIIETPFAEIHLEESTVFIEVTKTKVTVSVLGGSLVKIIPRAHEEEQLLAPGFSNWYGGVGPNGQEFGVAMVVDLNSYANKRAHFFTDHKVGFVNELKRLAGVIQYASKVAAQMHRNLVHGKIAYLQDLYDKGVLKRKKRREYNRYLRQLFRRKVNYDD